MISAESTSSRPDLGDRAIFLTQEPIAEVNRRPEAELWREFESARPRILGALLDAAVHGLRNIEHVQRESLPRMADFALWAGACETVVWHTGTFAAAYAANRRATVEKILEADPLAICVGAIMAQRTHWTGSASSLCADTNREDASLSPPWARTPRVLAGRLRRAQTFLRSIGIEITFPREGRTGSRMIRVSTRAENCVSSVSLLSSADAQWVSSYNINIK
jgi:hypothetical protein